MKTSLNQQRLWPYHQNILTKTFPTIHHNLCFKTFLLTDWLWRSSHMGEGHLIIFVANIQARFFSYLNWTGILYERWKKCCWLVTETSWELPEFLRGRRIAAAADVVEPLSCAGRYWWQCQADPPPYHPDPWEGQREAWEGWGAEDHPPIGSEMMLITCNRNQHYWDQHSSCVLLTKLHDFQKNMQFLNFIFCLFARVFFKYFLNFF